MMCRAVADCTRRGALRGSHHAGYTYDGTDGDLLVCGNPPGGDSVPRYSFIDPDTSATVAFDLELSSCVPCFATGTASFAGDSYTIEITQ